MRKTSDHLSDTSAFLRLFTEKLSPPPKYDIILRSVAWRQRNPKGEARKACMYWNEQNFRSDKSSHCWAGFVILGKLINFLGIMTSIALVGMRNKYNNVYKVANMCSTWQVHKEC